MPTDFSLIFAFAWFTNMAYVATLVLLMSKLDRLESPSAPAKPIWSGISSDFALRALRFLFSGRHNDFDDRQLSRLVMICRTLFTFGAVLTTYVFWRAWSLA
jgi:hypothetical protein